MTSTPPQIEPEMIPPVAYDSLAGLVHDLGSYIQVAMSAVNIIARHSDIADSEGLGTIVSHAADSLEQAGALVRLTISPDARAHEEEVDIDICLTQMAHLLRYASGQGIRIRRHTGRLPKVRCSRLELQNALLNLALNARDAMPGGGTLTISALLADGPETPEVEILVSDTGIGMAPDILARALEPRFSTKPFGGGIGLPGVKRFVEMAGGRLSIDSTIGVGTRVIMRLPASVNGWPAVTGVRAT